MSVKLIVLAALTVPIYLLAAHAAEDAQKDEIESLRQQGYTINAVTPIFSQLLFHQIPKGFKSTFENVTTQGTFYIHEFVPDGETVENWTQMMTDTGSKDLASNARVSPQAFAFNMANGFKEACPESFSVLDLGTIKLGEYDAFGVVASCGTVSAATGPHSESALIVAIKGKKDYYTVQWAERGPISSSPIRLDGASVLSLKY